LTQEVRALERVAPESRLREQRQRLDTFALRLDRAWTSQRQRQESRLDGLQGRLAALNPRATIARGYAIVSDEGTSALVRSAATVTPGQRLHIAVEDGAFPATAGDRNDF
jgi:exodeoxyribonuclease VII large subunit